MARTAWHGRSAPGTRALARAPRQIGAICLAPHPAVRLVGGDKGLPGGGRRRCWHSAGVPASPQVLSTGGGMAGAGARCHPGAHCLLALGTHLLPACSAWGLSQGALLGKAHCRAEPGPPALLSMTAGEGAAENLRGCERPALPLFCLSPALGAWLGVGWGPRMVATSMGIQGCIDGAAGMETPW